MHPDTHLLLHHRRSAELRERAAESAIAPAAPRTAPRAGLRTRLGWFLVESGLRLLPRHAGHHGRASLVPGTA